MDDDDDLASILFTSSSEDEVDENDNEDNDDNDDDDDDVVCTDDSPVRHTRSILFDTCLSVIGFVLQSVTASVVCRLTPQYSHPYIVLLSVHLSWSGIVMSSRLIVLL